MRGKNSKRYPTGSMAHENWKQFAALLRQDNRVTRRLGIAKLSRRIKESIEPMREHAALVESDKQNRFAAELWKHNADEARKKVRNYATMLEMLAPQQHHDVADLLRSIAEDLRSMV